MIYPGLPIADYLPNILVFSLAYGLLCAGLTSWGRDKLNYLVSIFLGAFISAVYMAQYVYHLFFKTPLLVFSIFKAGQVTEFAGEAARMIFSHLPQLLVFLIPLLVIIICGKKAFPRCQLRQSIILLAAAVLFYGAALAILPLSGDEQPNSAYNCYYNENNPLPTQQKLGVITFMQLDARRMIWGFFPKDVPHALPMPGLAEDAFEIEGSGDTHNPADTESQPDDDYNELDIDFASLLAKESDPIVRRMHQYFSELQPSRKNEYTGKFAGKNLIIITAESFYYPLLDTGLFPTVKRLATEGFTFTDAYTPIWNVSTSDGEYSALNSLLPASGVWSFARSAENYLPFALGRQFSGLGYESVYAFHNHRYDYYERQLSHPNMGYTYLARGNGLEITEQWPESDLELMASSLPYYIDSESFHVYDLTVSGHLEYDFDKNAMAAKHKGEVDGLGYSDEVSAYIAANLELEQSLAYLLQQLEDKGKLDNTVIVLCADHYPYGLSDSAINELVGHTVEQNFELYRNTIAIWSADQEHLEIDEPICSLDILPTLSNLFDLPFDSRLMMGRDIFSDSAPLVVFNNRSWVTDRARYDAATDTLYGDVPQSYVDTINEIVNAKFLYSSCILFKDYYRLILGE